MIMIIHKRRKKRKRFEYGRKLLVEYGRSKKEERGVGDIIYGCFKEERPRSKAISDHIIARCYERWDIHRWVSQLVFKIAIF